MFYKKTSYYSEKETYDMFCVAYVLGIIRKNVSLLTELILFLCCIDYNFIHVPTEQTKYSGLFLYLVTPSTC